MYLPQNIGTLKVSSKVGTPLDSVWLCVSQLLLNSLLESPQIKATCATASSLVTSSSISGSGVWGEISELWYLSIQGTVCVSTCWSYVTSVPVFANAFNKVYTRYFFLIQSLQH